MNKTVLLDTSFLITLLDSTRVHHHTAKSYYTYFLENNYPLFLSTIVIAEYCHKGKLEDLPTDDCTTLPFNVSHALKCAELNFQKHRTPDTSRIATKDDFKLLGQATSEKLGFVITDDANTLYNYTQKLRQLDSVSLRCVKLEDGIDVALVNQDKQRELPIH